MTARSTASLIHAVKAKGIASLTPEDQERYRAYQRDWCRRNKSLREQGGARAEHPDRKGTIDEQAEIRQRATKIRLDFLSPVALPVLGHPVEWRREC